LGELVADAGDLVGYVGRDQPGQPIPFGGQVATAFSTRRGLGSVGDPFLAALLVPGPCQPLNRLAGIGGGDIDVAGGPGSAHSHIGQLAPTAVVEDVSDIHGRILTSMGGDGIPVAQTLGSDVLGSHPQPLAVRSNSGQLLRVRIHGGDLGGLGRDPDTAGSVSQGDDPVASPLPPPAGSG
jgi:hypothetical protein